MDNKQQRQKNLKKRKHQRLLRYIVLLVVVVSILAVSGYLIVNAVRTGVFNIKHIHVEGNEIIDEASVIEASGIQEGDNIFLADLNQAHAGIENVVNVKKLEIKKVMPDTIVINMQEMPSICAINIEGTINYLDENGVLVEQSNYLRKTDIPIITGFNDITIDKIGRAIVVNPGWKFQSVMDMLKALEKDGSLSKISEINVTEDNTYKIITKNNVVMTVSDYEGFVTFHDYIQTVLSENRSNLDINLTAGSNPVIKNRS